MEEKTILKITYPIGDFNCQDYPPIEGKEYAISEEELAKLGRHELKFSTDPEGKTILVPNDPTEENRKREAFLRIAELKKLLADSDYKAIKYAEGVISASEYVPIKAKREMWRKEINDLEKLL